VGNANMHTLSMPLREDVVVTIRVPRNLTAGEADRVASLIKLMPAEGTALEKLTKAMERVADRDPKEVRKKLDEEMEPPELPSVPEGTQ